MLRKIVLLEVQDKGLEELNSIRAGRNCSFVELRYLRDSEKFEIVRDNVEEHLNT